MIPNLPCGSASKESACNMGDLGLIPGLGRFPWRRAQLPTTVFWPGEFHGLYSPWGCKESDTTERLSLSHDTMANLHTVRANLSIGSCLVILPKHEDRRHTKKELL